MASESFDVEFSKPLYSFLDETLKFPSDFNVSDWIKITKLSLKSDSPEDIDGVVQQLVDSQTGGSDFGSSLVSNLNAIGFNMSEHCNDLKVYLCILLEVFPKMLMIEPSTNLRELKSSLLHFLDDDQFASLNQKNLTNFKLLLKNLIGLNDLLINLVKYVFKDTLIMGDLHHVFDNSNHDNLINSLVDSLIIFDMTESLNYSFLNDNVNNLKAFFLVDLHQFFEATQLATIENSEVKSEEPEFESLTSDFKMTNYEFTSLLKFLSLIDNGLVKNFNQFPIFMMINFLNLVSNDFLKSVYFKHVNSSSSAFSHWWSINCFLQDYVSMVGELYGLYNEIYRIS
ncbi:hypothetical protein CANTEDRAFT_127104 [Yamadazyma tenuis ATCC 10573]|uniref:Uncharacterized protein n=2 Tax=Candida tenuis TaxID=2315449 RepID=G3BCA7_CANTC|nr:uncharacterized protein CANTEDRAFT_127104 [Yamadazyma tenuis ATCC 10573]XP_006689369.1 uncharacterized protein CANTEDRAFT_127104 [Yamadazyma tenuis ATCC 10573]EGV60154.1 hypothetical protein CANTEDRAFT_127104 [Yamadazyma tenuis ATCC 10573]EGV60155.1 hypothetical protein CANTEDRAFT_127104 [Yamadazyma tenuis ATCC 10573]